MVPSAEEYKSWIEKYINNHDTREINFQYDVVKRLLERIFPEYDIVSVDTKGCNTENHNYYAYSGKYVDEMGREKPTTPDLLVCKNWDWYNVENDTITYIATVEVKSPYSSEAIYKKEREEYPFRWKTKIETHLSAQRIQKVIFTDTFKWEFYENSFQEADSIELVNRKKAGKGYTFEWKEDAAKQFEKLLDRLKGFLKVRCDDL